MITDEPLTAVRIYVFLLTSEIFNAHLDGSVSSDGWDRITANKANVIRPCVPSAPLLTTDPFFDLVIWQLGFINQTQLPTWLTVSAVNLYSFMVSGLSLLIFVLSGNSSTAQNYCTLSYLALFRCVSPLNTQKHEYAFYLVVLLVMYHR